MNMTLKKSVGLLVATVLAVSSITMLAGCEKEKKETTISGSVSATVTTSGSVSPTAANQVPLESLYDASLVALMNKTYTINGNTISAGEFNFYMVNSFTQFSQYAYSGYYPATATGMIDLTAACDYLETGTWADYLASFVEKDIQRRYLLSALATESGMVLSDDKKAAVEASVDSILSQAEAAGLSGDGFVSQYFGDNMTIERFRAILSVYQLADQYLLDYVDNYNFSDEELQLPTVRHILYMAVRNSKDKANATEAEIAEAKALAEATLASINSYEDVVLAGDRDLTAGLAAEAAQYTVSVGQMVPEFEQWCYDPARMIGDKGIVQTDYGFHVMFYVGKTKATEEEKTTIAQNALSDLLDQKATLPEFTLVAQ
jgi:hypothetical protein